MSGHSPLAAAPALPDDAGRFRGWSSCQLPRHQRSGRRTRTHCRSWRQKGSTGSAGFKVHLTGFVLSLPVLGAVWVLSEYFEEHTWPSRFASAPDVAGTWDPWFFFAAGIWFIILVIHALRAYLGPPVGPLGRYIRRPIARAELDREVERLKGRR